MCRAHPAAVTAVACDHCGFPVCPECVTLYAAQRLCPTCADEEEKIQALRAVVDTAALAILNGDVAPDVFDEFVEGVRDRVLAIFPDKAEVFDLIYRPRFARLRPWGAAL